MRLSKILLLSLASVSLSRQAFAQQLQAHAWPLAVKSPYLNAWYEGGPNPEPLNAIWPSFWNSLSAVGWYCDVQVDGVPYRIMGEDSQPASNTSQQFPIQITPTRTIIEVQTGPVNITMTFLSTIMAMDLTRQSLPFSYFFITASSIDGLPHEVKVYSDISAEWIAGNTNLSANATGIFDDELIILQASLQSPQLFTEIDDHAQDSFSIYAMKNSSGVKYQVGIDDVVRDASINSTGLQNSIDQSVSSHPINNPFDVWGISADLGNVTNTTSPAVWTIGIMRDPAIQFTMLSSDVHLRSSYYRMNFSTIHDATSFFLNDFENALNISAQLDVQIADDASKISPEYIDLLSIVSRQAMSEIEITVSKDGDGSFNSSDVMAFLKNMGDVGDGGVNSVDILYSAFPMYLYFNPDIGGYLLKPLLVSQDSPRYTQSYAAQGLGSNFPEPVVSNIPHNFGIEQSGNMIIMLLAHLQASGDDSLIKNHYPLISDWAEYLVQNSLNPNAQQTSSSDGISSINQTNLSLKGVIGICAMAKISHFMGMESDASNYQNIADSYIGQWQNLSLSGNQTRLLTSFQDEASAGLIYNMYADKLLQLNLIPQSVYEVQTAYYNSQLASSKFGIPLDSSTSNLTRADWMLFAGAASGDAALQRSFISLVHSYAFSPSSNTPLSPIYDPTTGVSPMGLNSPAMGGIFASLALNKTLRLKIGGPVPSAPNGLQSAWIPKPKADLIPRIAGVAIGGLTLLALLALAIIFVFRRKKSTRLQILAKALRIHKGEPQHHRKNELDPFILPSKLDGCEILLKDGDEDESKRRSSSMQIRVPSTRSQNGSLALAYREREVARLRNEIRLILGDESNESCAPPSYASEPQN